MQDRPECGKNCRLPAAPLAAQSQAAARTPERTRQRRTATRFAQFPPAALFRAISRAGLRQMRSQRIASGTGLAWGRLVLASEGA